VDILYVDRAFIMHLTYNRDDRAIARSIIGMVHGLSMTVIAEVGEARRQFVSMPDERCEEFQGFHCRPAMESHDLESLLPRHGLVIPSQVDSAEAVYCRFRTFPGLIRGDVGDRIFRSRRRSG
jgi:predicted signal transduction protein with EAL and GGDEF domain